MDAVRVAVLGAALAAGCTTPSSTTSLTAALPGGAVATTTPTARPQSPADKPAVVQTSAVEAAGATRQIRVVALVGTDAVITDDEVWQMVRHRRAELDQADDATRAEVEKRLFREELRRLVERELVIVELNGKLKKSAPHKIDELKEEVSRGVDRYIKDVRKGMGNPSDGDFDAILGSQRLTLKGLRRQFERSELRTVYVNEYLKEKKKAVGLAEVRQYYDDHPQEYAAEDRVKWLDLFVAASRFSTPEACRQAAADLARQARGGADFVGLVKQHGHGDSSLRGGEGIGSKRGEVRPAELEPAVFGLAAGQVSDPLPTETGYHVVKVLERETAGRKPFDAGVQTAVRRKLLEQFHQAEVQKLIDDLWRKTTVEFVGVP